MFVHGSGSGRFHALAINLDEDTCVLLLEAAECLAAKCRRVTRYVIFQAASWSAYAWVAHREALSLAGVIPILKLVGLEPIPPGPALLSPAR